MILGCDCGNEDDDYKVAGGYGKTARRTKELKDLGEANKRKWQDGYRAGVEKLLPLMQEVKETLAFYAYGEWDSLSSSVLADGGRIAKKTLLPINAWLKEEKSGEEKP